ncbi:MAG: hypothetical protein OEV99_03655 [Nitrospira sp.]|nr:hypothetical protein [Nitrospira sp.]MDH4368916.1 hypothetical protein [Nitrospira sp.]MDH5347344.1 hypothetical protein [Nitrospira sp.]MDH5496771.1 hypothetical protein [Nitrospira sp.]MDH5724675.1 hypothetical protein [Nitrospira sp.]
MAQKFGNGRWVREGFLDNRVEGTVVGRVVFAVIGSIDFYLRGNFKPDIAGEVIQFRNGRFEDDDMAGQIIGDMANPQLGTVNLISLDPHPNLEPHPYVEWFTLKKDHYRFELTPGDAWVLSHEERKAIDEESQRIRETLAKQESVQPGSEESTDWI